MRSIAPLNRTCHGILPILAVLGLACQQPPQAPQDAYFDQQLQALQSSEWSLRRDALTRLEAYGPAANGAFLSALGDKSDALSRQALDALVRQGHTVVPYLADALAGTTEDRGLFARIAGGLERHRGRSIASALWLTVGRGVAPELRLGELERLLEHSSAKVRAVAVFTAVTLRSNEFLPVFEKAATDTDPLVRQALRQGLVRLLQQGSFSTPPLDAETEGRALDLLSPLLVEAAEDTELGFTQGPPTWGEMLGEDPLQHHRVRFRDLLRDLVGSDALSTDGQQNLGLALLRQSEPGELEGLATELLATVDRPDVSSSMLPAELIALSAFPGDAFSADSLELVVDWIEATPTPHRAAAVLSAVALGRAAVLEDTELGSRAQAVLVGMLEDRASLLEAAVVTEPFVAADRVRPSPMSSAVKEAIAPRADALWDLASEASAARACDLVRLFWLLEDPRYLEIFEGLWQRRATLSPRDAEILNFCTSYVGWRIKDPRLVDLLRPEVEAARDLEHSLVLDTAASVLVGALSAQHESFWSDEVFATWMSILEDPEIHPRLRARMTMMLSSPALTEEQHDTLHTSLIQIAAGPADPNLRDKILSRLTYRGDRRILPEAYALLTDRDQPHWALSNVISNHPGAAWRIETDELIDILDGRLRRYGPPEEDVRLVVPGNYFKWAVQYQIYPQRWIVEELRKRTQQDFGEDVDAWRQWVAENPVGGRESSG